MIRFFRLTLPIYIGAKRFSYPLLDIFFYSFPWKEQAITRQTFGTLPAIKWLSWRWSDVICGLNATIGILVALKARRHTGCGQLIETSPMGSALGVLVNQASSYLLADVGPQKLGNRHPSIVPYETYHAADRPFAVAAGNHTLWECLCEALDLTELLDDERFATNAVRVAHIDELGEILNNAFAMDSAGTWIGSLGTAGVPAGHMNDIRAAFELATRLGLDPLAEVSGVQTGAPLQLVSSPLKISGTPPTVESAPPRLGEHSEEIRAWLQKGG